MGKQAKISVIGVGHLGTIHARLLKKNDFAELVGIYDIDNSKAKELSRELGCKPFESVQDAVEAADAVIISTTTSTHYEIAIECIERGKHCFIEKPITATYKQALDIIEKASKKGVLIQVGHVERFNPALQTIIQYKPTPLFIESHRLSQFKPRAIDVSVVFDLMIHDIDIILWFIKSKVKHISANGVPVLTETNDIANARLEFENGAVANLTASRITAKPIRKMRIFQKHAYFSIDLANQKVEVYRIPDPNENIPQGTPAVMLGNIFAGTKDVSIIYEVPEVKESNAITEEQTLFCRSILFGEPIRVSALEASEALKIAEEIDRITVASLQSIKINI